MSCGVACDLAVGDIGTQLDVLLVDENLGPLPIDLADSFTYLLTRPSGKSTSHPATIEDVATARLRYTTQEGDIDEPGLWWIEVSSVTTDPAWQGISRDSFMVRDVKYSS